MNIRYFFAICAIVLSFSSVAKASNHPFPQETVSVINAPTVSKISLLCSEQVDSLLNRVILYTTQSNNYVFEKAVQSTFKKIKRVFVDLWRYLYASIFYIFK